MVVDSGVVATRMYKEVPAPEKRSHQMVQQRDVQKARHLVGVIGRVITFAWIAVVFGVILFALFGSG